ncbi:M20 aminoacylase family protein [Fulvimarina sp. MAC3]|uniref:M20 aminoacylase family protein n=1 Tax=Fulvimarina sp. MAC3 TaxID=3148887 RepID=UPI0031FBDBB3
MKMNTIDPDHVAEAVAWRHDLHRHPELAFEENRTADFVASHLSKWGYDVKSGIGGTGVLATLGEGGPAIGIRADMDALPITEETGLPYASNIPGKMHACGHDGHTATLLLAARHLAKHPPQSGRVHFIFQPAEEGEAGADAMIRDGVLDLAPCEEIYALHNWPGLEIGTISCLGGPMMAAFAVFDVTVRGKGSHAAMPHLGDPVVSAAASIASMLQEQGSRRIDPLDPAVLSVTRIEAGSAYNVLPSSATVSGTARWFSDTAGTTLERVVETVSDAVGKAHGCEVKIDYRKRYPATVNTVTEAETIREIAAAVGHSIVDAGPSMASEDFAFFLEKCPGAYFWLGAGTRESGGSAPLHSPHFDYQDDLIGPGAELWVSLAYRQSNR